jgi:hypothetical protein
METSGRGEPTGLLTHATTDPANPTSYREVDALLSWKQTFLAEATKAASGVMKVRAQLYGARDSKLGPHISGEEAEALRVGLVEALRNAAELLPCVGPAVNAFRAAVALRFAHGPVQTMLAAVIVVDPNKSLPAQLDAVAASCAAEVLAAVYSAGGHGDAATTQLVQHGRLRHAVITPLPLPLIYSVGLSALWPAFHADFTLVIGTAKRVDVAAQFVAVLPREVQEVVAKEDAHAAMSAGHRICARLADEKTCAQALTWLSAHLPPRPVVPKPPKPTPKPPSVGGIEGRGEKPPTGGQGADGNRRARTPAQQAQRDADVAAGACFRCHLTGHKSHECPTCRRCGREHDKETPCYQGN